MNLKGLLENFLTSGHSFDDSEYELKSKFILLNGMIFVTFFSILALTIMLFLNNEMQFASMNAIYLFIGVSSINFLRSKKNNHNIVIFLIPLFSIHLVVTALIHYPNDQIRISWFLVIIIASFFLGGKKLGFIVSLVSITTIILLYIFTDLSLTKYTLILAIIIILLCTIVVTLYEKREAISKKRLSDINIGLELRVKDEIKKRILIYEESNNELKKSAEKLKVQKNAYRELAYYDTLTGLPNRVLFYDRLKHSIDKSKRSSTKLAVLFLDLDNFKEINDSLGHHIGDEVLKVVSKRLEKKIRQSDSLARLGGDEFTLLLEDLKELSNIGDIAKVLIQTVSEPIQIQEHELYVTVSIGISLYPDDGTDTDALLKCADAAMYSAKKDGSNLSHFYKKEMTTESLERLELEISMRQALENDEFVVYYQPIFSSRENRLIGLEALVRWQHPQRGLLTPRYFIDVAESSAIIVQLGEVVLKKVALQLEAWYKKGFNPAFISVNLSVKQLRHQSLLPLISDILESTHFRQNWLELEITEGYTMQKPLEAIRLLKQIRRLGVSLSIDDFGTGYSSLSYLKKLPVNKLKIDRSFIKDVPKNREDKALIGAIVSMAKSMKLDVVAEGVETKEQRAFLEQIGCDKMQGYYFAKPMAVDEIEEIFFK
jgi:diguanylate cyclase (GGDEF)-like protein